MATDLQPVRSEATSKSAFGNKYEAFAEEQLTRARRRIRWLDLAGGGLGFLVLQLAYGLLMALCDRWLELASLTRQLAFVAYLLAAGVYSAFLLGGVLLRRINPYYAALRLERTLPAAKNSVVNWLDLRQQNVVPAFRSAIGYQAPKDLAKADMEQGVSTGRTSWVGGMAGGLFVVLLILFVFGPHQFFSLMNRAFRPFLEVTIPTRTRLSVTKPQNGDLTLPLGRA